MKRLIINSDDFGIHPAVNRAVCRAYDEGILTSASLMAGGAVFEDAVDAASHRKNLGIGIHLTLTGGLPSVLPPEQVPSLTWENGQLSRNYAELIKRDLQHKIDRREVYAEWEAQIRKILGTGLSVTHIDGHQHLHMWPSFFPIVMELAEKYRISCMRCPDEDFSYGYSMKALGRFAGKAGLSLLSSINRRKLRENGIRCADHFWGMMYGGHLASDKFMDILRHLKEGTNEIMCHPADDAETMEEVFGWGYHGDWELSSLLSRSAGDYIRENHIELISYKDLLP